ncbi:flagellar biosynthetic protein FliO [Rubrivirga sp.]|uniref:flagellar biosynthetic protein FliO n=1 Tax=Rubrivirga sp. TaxID=1885344 RepID=UPI003C71120F
MASLSALRDRASSAVVDPAPLRRAGFLAVALVVLLILGRAFGPDTAASSSPAERQSPPQATEQVAAPGSSWTGGRVIAIVLLLAGGGVALVLRRRSSSVAPAQAALEVLGTHSLGPGQSLRLVSCGGEVLLLSVGGDGARLLRHWPQATFDGADLEVSSFADVLAQTAPDLEVVPAADVLEVEPLAPIEVETPVALEVVSLSQAAPVLEAAPAATWRTSLPQFGAHA